MDVLLWVLTLSMVGLMTWCISAGTWVSREPLPWFLQVNTAVVLALFATYAASSYILQHFLGVYQGRMDLLAPDA